jgi:hypothetical protein
MKTHPPALLLSALALAACTSGEIHAVKMDDTLRSYATAIRWGQFESALQYQNPAKRKRLDLLWLKKNVHVSSYDTVFKKEDMGGNIFEQTVEIHYFIESEGVEKSLTDHQLWRYDEEKEKLLLETDLPSFR